MLPAALDAFPSATAVHVLRDGRDVVCSLLERGWLSARRSGESDDANLSYGVQPRFWVEPERREEFAHVSDARRAAWAWRRYVTAARSAPERTVELRYESWTLRVGIAISLLALVALIVLIFAAAACVLLQPNVQHTEMPE